MAGIEQAEMQIAEVVFQGQKHLLFVKHAVLRGDGILGIVPSRNSSSNGARWSLSPAERALVASIPIFARLIDQGVARFAEPGEE